MNLSRIQWTTAWGAAVAAAAFFGSADRADAQSHKLGHNHTIQRMGLYGQGGGGYSAPRAAYAPSYGAPSYAVPAAPVPGVAYAPAYAPAAPAYATAPAALPAAQSGNMVAVTGPDGVMRYFPAQGAAVQQQAGTPGSAPATGSTSGAATQPRSGQPAPAAAPAATSGPTYYYHPGTGWVPYNWCR